MKVDEEEVKDAQDRWRKAVNEMLENEDKYRGLSVVLPSIDCGNQSNSVIHIKVSKGDRILGTEELELLHKAMSYDVSQDFVWHSAFTENEKNLRQKCWRSQLDKGWWHLR